MKEDELSTIRNKESYAAIAHLKQSRRCAQLVERLNKMKSLSKGDSQYGRLKQLNEDAIKGITKHLDKEDQDDVHVYGKLSNIKDVSTNIMVMPTLTLHAKRCHVK